MLVIGLTGGIATGKSTVSTLLSNTHHIPVIDADVLARTVVEPGTPALRSIVSAFGPSILFPDGSLDRKKLGSIIFEDEKKRRILNGIVHPAVRRGLVWGVLGCWWRGEKVCVLDVPLLIEGGLWKLVGKVVVVHCSEETQLARLITRDSSTHDSALARLRSQLPIAQKLAYADKVISNSGTVPELEAEVAQFVQEIHREAGGVWWRLEWLIPPVGLLVGMAVLARRAVRRWGKMYVAKDE